jgi:hypothetical protein
MSIIHHQHDLDGRNVREKCMVCGTELKSKYHGWHGFPFLVWDEKESITICGKCCQKIKVGFMEDLIQITATMEMRQVRRYSDAAFQRTTQRALREQTEERIKREREFMRISLVTDGGKK